MRCVFCMHGMRCVFRFLIALQAMHPLRSIRCVACVAYDNFETARRPTKMDLKVGFQATVRNAMDATHAGHATQICMHTKNATDVRIELVACIAF